jgi:hypothetical protein
MEINNLIIEYLETRYNKVINIKRQNYDMAANFRDLERELSIKIFRIIKGDCNDLNYKQSEDEISNYCLKEFNCSIYDYNCIKAIKRHIKLKDLGI